MPGETSPVSEQRSLRYLRFPRFGFGCASSPRAVVCNAASPGPGGGARTGAALSCASLFGRTSA
jgi:hypothetical protein